MVLKGFDSSLFKFNFFMKFENDENIAIFDLK